jgi:hypothetical protein
MYDDADDDGNVEQPPPPYRSVDNGWGGNPENDPQPQQNAPEYYEYAYDEQNNWGQWAATIDEKIDALMAHKCQGREHSTEGEMLMAHVDKRIEDTISDYKREIHQRLTQAVSHVEEMHMQAISKMQVVSEKYIHELHEKHVQTVLLNQNLDAMGEVDDFQQKMHQKFYMERQGMLEDVDARLQMHAQKWELGHTPIMANVQKRLAELENGLQSVIQEVKNVQHVHEGYKAQAENRHASCQSQTNELKVQLSHHEFSIGTVNAKLAGILAQITEISTIQGQMRQVQHPPKMHAHVLLQRENEDLKRQLDMAKRARVFCESLTTPHHPAPGVKTIRPPQENPVHQGAPKGQVKLASSISCPLGGGWL